MTSSNLLIISKYGLKAVGYSFALFAFFYLFGFSVLATLTFAVFAFLLFAYRNPERELNIFDESSILAPCDGVVSAIEEVEGEYKVTIESSMFDVGVLRFPITATVQSVEMVHGTRLAKNAPQFNHLNESCSYSAQDKAGNTITVTHRLKQTPLPLALELKEQQELYKSLRYGYANNSVATLQLPQNIRLNIQVGAQVKAGESLLAYFS